VTAGPAQPPVRLTGRELEIVRLAGQHLTDRQIAKRLVLSPRTVEAHLANARLKTGSTTRAELAEWVRLHIDVTEGEEYW
jgi:DNA-binding CsgD family transcriptional regulator